MKKEEISYSRTYFYNANIFHMHMRDVCNERYASVQPPLLSSRIIAIIDD